MEKILNNIDQSLQVTFKQSGLKAYGLCELITKDGKVNPVTVNKDRIVAQIHDSFNGIFYHRILGDNPVQEDEEFSFGDKIKKRFTVRIRTVVAYKVKLGEHFMFDFVKAFPDKILTLTEYKFVLLTEGTLVADHEAVYTQEYGPDNYEKHRIPWNIFALEYDIEFMLC